MTALAGLADPFAALLAPDAGNGGLLHQWITVARAVQGTAREGLPSMLLPGGRWQGSAEPGGALGVHAGQGRAC